jgi:hypothetical protein
MNLKIFFGELTRHNVYKVADAYAVVGSLLIQRRFFRSWKFRIGLFTWLAR